MLPIIVSPHTFGLKTAQDLLFTPMAIARVADANPGADVFFLNPNAFQLSIPGVQDVMLPNKSEIGGLSVFADRYVHLSTNHENFEKFCIERFFYLKWFFDKYGIDAAYTIESDVVLVSALGSFPVEELALSERKCISTALITRQFLENFCDGVIRAYTDSPLIDGLKNWYAGYRAEGKMGGICDMSFCSFLASGQFGFEKMKIHDFSRVSESATGVLECFDSFIGRKRHDGINVDFEMDKSLIDGKEIKQIFFDSSLPYCKLHDGGKVVLKSIHCQGSAKSLMGLYFSYTRGMVL